MTALDCWFIALVPAALLVLVVWACCDTAGDVTEQERDRSCLCGHAFRVHEHYREGTDCGFDDGCTRFRAADVARVRALDLPDQHGVTDETPLPADLDFMSLFHGIDERGAA